MKVIAKQLGGWERAIWLNQIRRTVQSHFVALVIDGEPAMDRSRLTTAETIAEAFGLNAKSYRAALRRESFEWHEYRTAWLVSPGSSEQRDMLRVAQRMKG